MPLNMDLTSIQQSLKADMMYLRNFLDWCNARYQSYNQNLTTSVMNTAGISAGDQSIILQFIADLNMINQVTSNVTPTQAHSSVVFNIDNYLGLL
jgi:hypothetical protein